MTDRKQSLATGSRAATLMAVAALAYIVMQALFLSAPAHTLLSMGDNDDIMRVLSVRAWLGGQDWFDMTQYRVLAPDGVSLHWSRYVDLGIAAMIWPLTYVMAFEDAEAVALVWWPTLMLVVMMVLTGWVGRRVFGPWPAAIALVSMALWPIRSNNYFEPARMDHHNIQIFVMTVVVLSLLTRTPRAWGGAIAGLAAALSLAVGLENLLPIALAGLILCARVVLDPQRESGPLLGFSIALASGSLLAFMGQTARSEWLVAQCDQLSVPFLALALSAVFVSVVLVLGGRRLNHSGLRLGLLSIATIASLGVLAPLLTPCLEGPYAHLPTEVQTLIFEGIREALPLSHFVQNNHGIVYTTVLPLAAALLIAALILAHRLRHGLVRSGEVRAVMVLLLFAALGFIGAVFQIRMILMGAAAVPLLTGYAVHALAQARSNNQRHAPTSLALIASIAATLFAPVLYPTISHMLQRVGSAGAATASSNPVECRAPQHLRALNALPKGAVLAPGSLSTSLLLVTDHTVLAAPYHRSGAAIANGGLPFNADEAGFRAKLAQTGADYVLLCQHIRHLPDGFATQLLNAGGAHDLVPVALPEGSPLRVFEVTQ
ncbi:MAG: hypothetical protein ACI9AQ_002197 [Dinoroseobacter sp.]|jgi:hypothetical protein